MTTPARPAMGPDDPGPDPASKVAELEAELEAERAGAAHWRAVARHRGTLLDDLKGRNSVRAVLSAERRTAGLRRRLAAASDAVARAARRASVSLAALGSRTERDDRRAALDQLAASLPPAPRPEVAVLVLLVEDPAAPHAPGPGASDADPLDGTATDRFAATVVRVDGAARDLGRQVDALVRAHPDDLVALVRTSTADAGPGWLPRLVAAVTGDVVAAAPQVLHPDRPLDRATPHDLLARARGVQVVTDADGTPRAEAIAAGTPPEAGAGPVTVDAATAAALVVRADAYLAAGGLTGSGDADADVVDLCARLREHGRVVVVPDALVTDHRTVPDRAHLATVVATDAPAWRAVVERTGGRLVPHDATTFTITVAAPLAKVADRWGDWHLARGLAAGLERLGHPVRVQTQDRVDSLAGRATDVHVVVRGLVPVRATPGQRHVLWVISHPEDVDDAECDAADLVVVASPRFAAHLRRRTATPVELLHQATDARHFRPRPPDPRFAHDVTVVARSRDVLRPAVADALAAGLHPAVFGSGWDGLVPPGTVVADHVDHADLPAVYASARVVLNDHWDTMRTWGFVSNRIFDVAACGTPVVSDPLPELTELFGDLVPTWEGPDQLRAVVDGLLADPGAAGERAADLRHAVLAAHTFDHRARELVDHLARHQRRDR